MKEEKNIHPVDDLFKKSLEGYQPPPPARVWNSVQKGIGKSGGGKWRLLFTLPALIFLSSSILIIGGLVIYNQWFASTQNETQTISSIHEIHKLDTVDKTSALKSVHENDKRIVKTASEIQTGNQLKESMPISKDPTRIKQYSPNNTKTGVQAPIVRLKAKDKKPGTPTHTKITAADQELKSRTLSQDKGQISTQKNPGSGPVEMDTLGLTLSGNVNIPENISGARKEDITQPNPAGGVILNSPAEDTTQPGPDRPVKTDVPNAKPVSLWGVCVTATAGLGQVIMKEHSPLAMYSAYATVGIIYSEWGSVLETGLGISRYNDHGNFEFEFLRSDTTGYRSYTYFNRIDSSYLFVFKPVIDHKQILYGTTTKTSYTYLSIPLYFNQLLLQKGKLAFGLKMGPSLNLILERNEILPTYNIPGTSFINLKDNSIKRVSANWQLLVATRFSWQLTGHLALLLEPAAMVCLNNLYETNLRPVSNPLGIGIWGGMQYRFKK